MFDSNAHFIFFQSRLLPSHSSLHAMFTTLPLFRFFFRLHAFDSCCYPTHPTLTEGHMFSLAELGRILLVPDSLGNLCPAHDLYQPDLRHIFNMAGLGVGDSIITNDGATQSTHDPDSEEIDIDDVAEVNESANKRDLSSTTNEIEVRFLGFPPGISSSTASPTSSPSLSSLSTSPLWSFLLSLGVHPLPKIIFPPPDNTGVSHQPPQPSPELFQIISEARQSPRVRSELLQLIDSHWSYYTNQGEAAVRLLVSLLRTLRVNCTFQGQPTEKFQLHETFARGELTEMFGGNLPCLR